MLMTLRILSILFLVLFAAPSRAAIQKQKLETASVFRSGRASDVAYNLAGLRWSRDQVRERVVLDFTPQGQVVPADEIPYLNVEFRESKYIFIDMGNVLTGELLQKGFLQQVKSSKLINSSRMTFVPRTLTMNLSLELSTNAIVEVASLPPRKGQPARLVLDFTKPKKRGSK